MTPTLQPDRQLRELPLGTTALQPGHDEDQPHPLQPRRPGRSVFVLRRGPERWDGVFHDAERHEGYGTRSNTRGAATSPRQHPVDMDRPRCPICTATPPVSGPTIDVRLVIEALGLDGDLDRLLSPTPEVADPPIARLVTCSCGFQFFWPSITASGDFYARLEEDGSYYTGLRWDQEVALDHLVEVAGASDVIDFGCGSGTFLLAASACGLGVAGVDFNPASTTDLPVEVRVVKGDATDLPAIAEALPRADAVTAFQVLEHVAEPVELLVGLAGLVAVGGHVVVTVPNRDRFEVDKTQLLDCPPHHQTRWRVADLERAARRARLEPIRVVTQRELNPLRLAIRLARRLTTPARADWPLPPAAGPWPPSHLFNGQNLVAVLRRS